MRILSFPVSGPILMALAVALLPACSATPERPGELDEARQAVRSASIDPMVRRYAAVSLYEAEQELKQAEEAKSPDEIRHYAYLARQKARLAKEVSLRKEAENEIDQLAAERDELRIRVKEREAAQARSEAQSLQRELAALEARPTERGLVVSLGDIVFESGRAQLAPGARRPITQLAEFLRAHPDRNVLIEGHTDSRGNAAGNRALSEQRAEAVRDSIVAAGVAPQRIATRGYGEAQPIAPNDTAAGRQLNRRVDVVILNRGERGAGSVKGGK